MATILENLLTERILIDDFKSWLINDSLENSIDKADFIHYFIYLVRENCAWLLSKNNKALEASTKQIGCDAKFVPQAIDQIFPPKHENASSNYRNVSPKKKNEGGGVRYENRYKNQEQNLNQDVQSNTLYSEGGHISQEHIKRHYDDRNFRKTEHPARRSLPFNSPRNQQNARGGQIHIPDINSFDAFPPVGSKDNRNPHDSKIRRRITPTPIQAVHKGSSKFGNSGFAMPDDKFSNEVFKRTPVVEVPCSDLKNEREMLKMTRNQFSQSKTLPDNFSNLKIESNANTIKPVTANFVIPDPDKISLKNKLYLYSVVYEQLISHALVPNVTSELYFIFELITSKVLPEEKSENKNNVFCSIHNCVFFATSVLSKLKNFLHLLDNNTLSSLSEIPYLPKFSSQLVQVLKECSTEKHEILTKSVSLNRVPFILEEDCCENFLDNHAFLSFRKQRDLFYELLRDWKQQPLGYIDSRFRDSFSRKAKQLINLAPNAINIYHLAKLFQNQLIASCLGLEVSEVYDELLSDIQKIFPDKIEKLHQRFMMPFCVGEPSPPPSFYGTQAFFSELIQAAGSAPLNQHLQDIFMCKILELNSSDILSDVESISFSTVKEKYIFLLHTLRLVGKFLGYLHFLPYKISEPLSSNILNLQLFSRKHSVPPIDTCKLLKSALENGRVILTVPWIVEYLSMADPVGKSLPYVEETLDMLAAIYRGKYSIPFESVNFWFLRLIIGWLFDTLNYPMKYGPLVQPTNLQTNIQPTGIDIMAVIDKQLVYSCCPYLVEFRVVIYSFLNGIRKDKKRDVRKITPLSTTKSGLLTSSAKQQTQIQLEENFFFLQPPSLKKTVEFVSERIASKIIQKIRIEVTDFKLLAVESIPNQKAFKALLSSPSKTGQRNTFVDSYVLELYKKSQCKIAEFINGTCPEDINNIMPLLLADDIKPCVLEMCCKISVRLATEKIIDWCGAKLIFKDIKKDIQNKLNHISKGNIDASNEDDFNLSTILNSLRECILQNFAGSKDFSHSYIPLLREIFSVLGEPIGNSTKKLIIFLVVDFFISILVNSPERCDKECGKILISIWTLCPKDCSLENYFLGAQNIKLLIMVEKLELSCEVLDLMLTNLINAKVFSVSKLKSCLETLYNYKWNDSKVNILLHYIQNVLAKFDAMNLRHDISAC